MNIKLNKSLYERNGTFFQQGSTTATYSSLTEYARTQIPKHQTNRIAWHEGERVLPEKYYCHYVHVTHNGFNDRPNKHAAAVICTRMNDYKGVDCNGEVILTSWTKDTFQADRKRDYLMATDQFYFRKEMLDGFVVVFAVNYNERLYDYYVDDKLLPIEPSVDMCWYHASCFYNLSTCELWNCAPWWVPPAKAKSDSIVWINHTNKL